MFAITRQLVRTSALRHGIQHMQINPASSQVSMKIVPVEKASTEHPFERNIRLGREMSPHLTIYKPQLTSLLSVTHRATGMALATYAYALGLGALVGSHDIAHYVTIVQGLQLSTPLLIGMKFTLAYPFAYHFLNGIRHLLWDSGKFLKIKEVYSTGYAMVGLSILVAAALASL